MTTDLEKFKLLLEIYKITDFKENRNDDGSVWFDIFESSGKIKFEGRCSVWINFYKNGSFENINIWGD